MRRYHFYLFKDETSLLSKNTCALEAGSSVTSYDPNANVSVAISLFPCISFHC